MRFDFIQKICDETVIKPKESKEHLRSVAIDKILTGKYTAIPCFIGIMGLVFFLTFGVIGAFLSDLLDLGMCAAEYMQMIPKYIRRLGVVTAPTGAAVRDIINITKRRNPFVQIILYPALVQGEGAAESIVKGIHALEAEKVDVMIVGRGG